MPAGLIGNPQATTVQLPASNKKPHTYGRGRPTAGRKTLRLGMIKRR
jgi:hypothetical protein